MHGRVRCVRLSVTNRMHNSISFLDRNVNGCHVYCEQEQFKADRNEEQFVIIGRW